MILHSLGHGYWPSDHTFFCKMYTFLWFVRTHGSTFGNWYIIQQKLHHCEEISIHKKSKILRQTFISFLIPEYILNTSVDSVTVIRIWKIWMSSGVNCDQALTHRLQATATTLIIAREKYEMDLHVNSSHWTHYIEQNKKTQRDDAPIRTSHLELLCWQSDNLWLIFHTERLVFRQAGLQEVCDQPNVAPTRQSSLLRVHNHTETLGWATTQYAQGLQLQTFSQIICTR